MRSSESLDSPGIPFPPPVIFVLAYGIGLVLQRFLAPLGVVRGKTAIAAVAFTGRLLMAASALLAVSGFLSLLFARTSPVPWRPARSLIVHGPYRYTRNPLYLSLALLHGGLALVSNALWPLVLLAPALVAIQVFVLGREERYLLRTFGAEYEVYRSSVRRWL